MGTSSDNPAPVRHSRGRILIADDEKILVDVISEMVTSFGFDCKGFTSSSEALTELRQNVGDYDILICDQSMPLLSGDELINQALNIAPSIGVVLISGHSEGSLELTSLRSSQRLKVLRKPFSMDQLEKTLALIQGEHRSS